MKIFAGIALATLSTAAMSAVQDSDAASYIGQRVTLDCRVVAVKESAKATFANCGGAFPNQSASVVEFAGSGARVDLRQYEGKHLLINGVLRSYKGKPEIVLESASQIQTHQ